MNKYLNRDFILEHKSNIIKVGIGVIITIIIVATIGTNLNKGDDVILEDNTQQITSENSDENTSSDTSEHIIVDISGSVLNESVVELPQGSRVEDAIEAAGGLTKKADVSGINRAAILEDGEKIYIPSEDDDLDVDSANTAAIPDRTNTSGQQNDSSSKVNINTASSEELQTLSGVGPATADKIISYRETYGNFTKIEDLTEVNGIGDKTFAKLKDLITI